MTQPPLKTIIEVLLFTADEPLTLARLNQALEEEFAPWQLKEALSELEQDYEKEGRAFSLREVAGGFQIRTRPEMAPFALKLKRKPVNRLSQAALETLAVIAYRQPVLKAEIDKVRGVETGAMIRSLIEKGLVRIMGRRNLPGRPLVYGTTKKFLETFDLPDLEALPTLEEMEKLALNDEPKLF